MAAKNVIIRTAALERAYKSRTEGISMEKLTVEQALEALLEHTKVIEETETVPLLQACGRVLAKDMIAGFDNPPFDRSPVDGYACKAEDITDASESHPVQLTVLEEIDAGQYSRASSPTRSLSTIIKMALFIIFNEPSGERRSWAITEYSVSLDSIVFSSSALMRLML